MFCPNCNSQISRNDAFCGKCGTYFYGEGERPVEHAITLTFGEKVYLIIMGIGMIYQYLFLSDQAVYAFVAPFFLGLFKSKKYPNYRSFSKPFKGWLIVVFIAFSVVFFIVGSDSAGGVGSVLFIILAPILVIILNLAVLIVSIVTYTIGFLLFKIIR